MDKNNFKENTFRDLVSPYIKNWKYFLILIFIMGVLAILYIKSKAPVYRAQTSVLIKDAKKMSAASGDMGVLSSIGGFSGMGTNSIENELGVFQSKSIVEDVLKELNFQTTLYAQQSFADIELYGSSSPYIINVVKENPEGDLPKVPIVISSKNGNIVLSSEEWQQEIKTSFGRATVLPFATIMVNKNPRYKKSSKIDLSHLFFTYSSFEEHVVNYQQSLVVDLLDRDGTIITLSIDLPNKDKAKDFLNRLVRQYNVYAINDKNIESQKTKDFIDQRIAIISQDLGDVENQKASFKSSNNMVDLPTEARISLQKKEQSKNQLLELGTQQELLSMLSNTLKKKRDEEVLPLNIGLQNEAAVKAIQEYNVLVAQRNKYLQEATPNNPLVQNLSRQLEEMKSSLSETLDKNVASLEISRRQVETQLGGSETMIGKIPNQEKAFRGIERQQQIKESLYLLLLEKREEAAISMEITADKARVVDRAFVLKKPVAPRKMMILGGFLFVGFIIPFAFIYLKNLMMTTVVTRKDITKLTEVPVLGELPRLKNRDQPLVHFNDVSPMAEAFRILVTNLKFLLPAKNTTQTIMVTSSVKGEGKTFVSTNLSIILASIRSKVLVIGADVRNPQLQRYNPSMKSAKGLTEFLSGDESSVQEIIFPSGYNENCDFIYSGSIPPNATELLQNGRLTELLEQVDNLQKYKYIVLDTAPLLLVTDSFLLADKADAIVYVTRSEITEKSYLDFLNSSVQEGKLSNVGLVLNGLKEANFGYGNKYGYGYNADDHKRWWQKIFRS